MENYIVTLFVKTGHEDDVVNFYRDLEDQYQAAPGFRGREIYLAKPGTMAAWVRKNYTQEELAKHAEPPHEDKGVQLVIVEQWDSVDERMKFSKTLDSSRQKAIFPHLMPNHHHEFFENRSAS